MISDESKIKKDSCLKHKKIVFLTSLIPDCLSDEVKLKMKKGMPDAANALQWHFIEGFYNNFHSNINLINVLPISSYPNYYDDLLINKKSFCTEYSPNNINVGFINFKGLRRYSIERNVYNELCSAFSKNDEGILFVYTLSSSFMKAVKKFKKVRPKIHVCSIVADLPSMNDLSEKTGIINKIANKTLAKTSFDNLSSVNSFVLLTKQMADYLKITQPFCVVEGISTVLNHKYNDEIKDDGNVIKNILYTGTLHRKFGILNLVEAFMTTTDRNYRLQICGTGDSEEEIQNSANQDERICYFGKVDRKKVLELQSSATVLVNPRQNNEEFTKYSFPSKNLEYLSSGTPVIAYMLDGMPLEYGKYIISPENNSIEALRNAIDSVCSLSQSELKKIGDKGKKFVIKEKNSIKQTEKIVNMINAIMEGHNERI